MAMLVITCHNQMVTWFIPRIGENEFPASLDQWGSPKISDKATMDMSKLLHPTISYNILQLKPFTSYKSWKLRPHLFHDSLAWKKTPQITVVFLGILS